MLSYGRACQALGSQMFGVWQSWTGRTGHCTKKGIWKVAGWEAWGTFQWLAWAGAALLGISQETTGGSLFIGCLPHQKECFLMHFGKHIFSWKTNHLLLNLYFRMKYYPLLFNRKKTATFTILHLLPSFLSLSLFPVFIVNDTQSGFTLQNLAWQRPIWRDMYCPQEALPLAVDCEKRYLVSFKWRQQYFRLPDQGRFYTVEVGTDCV